MAANSSRLADGAHTMKPLLAILPALTLLAAEAIATMNLIDEARIADEAADAAVAAIASPEELTAKQAEWRAAWLDAMGGLPEGRTPLNARVMGVAECDGFRIKKHLWVPLQTCLIRKDEFPKIGNDGLRFSENVFCDFQDIVLDFFIKR